MSNVCLTVDVEDWYDGMAVLGQPIPRPEGAASGLSGLGDLLQRVPDARVTLFVVGDYAPRVREELVELIRRGHEVASHGPDHGRLPTRGPELENWLRAGREGLEDLLQTPIVGFRSPRFDIPTGMALSEFRQSIGVAGYRYVSDVHRMGPSSPIEELPVFRPHGLPMGGGSYQRLLPSRVITELVKRDQPPSILYYHSYDFGATLPTMSSIRSAAVAKQLLGRHRVSKLFLMFAQRYGSEACTNVAS